MNFRFLETAVRLAELRNFRATADQLNITPAAISNRVSAMEQELGVRIFERDTKEVKVTLDGETFIKGARKLLQSYDELIASIHPQRGLQGCINIGVVPSLAWTILPQMIETVRNVHPRVKLRITTSSSKDMLHKLNSREIDVALCVKSGECKIVESFDICTFGMNWVSNPRFFQLDKSYSLTRQDLLEFPIIISYDRGSHNYNEILKYFAAHNMNNSTIHYSDSLMTTISMLKCGIGISVMPPIVIQKELAAGELKLLDTTSVFPSTTYVCAYHGDYVNKLTSIAVEAATVAARAFCGRFSADLATQIA